jgi:DNA ligase D-like protein (predicted ligase)/DNA ligase D-like protein (predicted polymerase)/DNA ligase D-like protein (predicted 3'-phosphoesterase)
VDAGGREVRLSNIDKPYWPPGLGRPDGAAITKGDLLAYYANVAPLALPHLRDRPLTMHRMPEGLLGQPFYEKQVPAHAPAWLPTTPVPVDGERKLTDFVMAQDVASLLYVVNLGCIELHPLHSRAGSLDRPDYAFFDLDPFEPYTFADVRAVARLVKVVLDGLGLKGWAKTSGATGMQIMVPLDGTSTYSDTRAFVERVGQLMLRAWPEKVTMAWPIAERTGKIFVDHNMNRQGANIAGVYSVRPRKGAPVSTPLDWDELDEDLEPEDFRIDNVWERFAHGDRFAPVQTERQSLAPAMDALGLTAGSGDTSAPAKAPTRRSARRTSRWGSATSARAPETARDLAEYDRKRDFSKTPEPGVEPTGEADGAIHPAGLETTAPLEPGRRFVIQQHHATRLHHDVRFERDGVLVSFAVPRRLPEEPGIRRLAVHTEDHPLDYLTFTGEIPAGEYGGGQVRLFDLGSYEELEEHDGKLSVRLHGGRYKGAEFHFFRTSDRDWICLLAGRRSLPQPAPPPDITPMLASPSGKPFDDDGWLFEVKWDGHRCLASLGTSTRLTSRTGNDATSQFPELAGLHRQLAARNALVDGEVAAMDEHGRPSFERMQDRFHRSPEELRREGVRIAPVQFLAFDLLWLDGRDLCDLPLERRQELLAEVLVENETVRLSRPVRGHGVAFYEQAKALGLEGIVAKRAASTYKPGRRSPDWKKIKTVRRQDCVVVGWTPGQGNRSRTLGSLLLAVATDDGLAFAGHVGTGFTGAFLDRLMPELEDLEIGSPPLAGMPRIKGARWVRPELVCEVEFQHWTREGRLRAPSFKGFRDDKTPAEAVRE